LSKNRKWICLFSLVCLSLAPLESDSSSRQQAISQLVLYGLQNWHYSVRSVDDQLSRSAFTRFLEYIDFTKGYLLHSDINRLAAYRLQLDDELKSGTAPVVDLAQEIFQYRVAQVRNMCQQLLTRPFDFSSQDLLETDVKKRGFCSDLAQLRQYWSKQLKYLALIRFLDLQKNNSEPAAAADLEKRAREGLSKNMDQLFKRLASRNHDDMYYRFLNALTAGFDPHSQYFPPRDQAELEIEMAGALEGIGVLLGEVDGNVKILEVMPGSPAWIQNTLKVEDIVIKVAQAGDEPVDVAGMSVPDVASLIRGKKGTEVRVTVKRPNGMIVEATLVRHVIEVRETYARSVLITNDKLAKTFGYIYLPKFYHDFNHAGGRSSIQDVKNELERMNRHQVAGVILDLRNNGGGILDDAVKMSGLFIEKGPIVQVKGRDLDPQIHSDQDEQVVYAGPLVVLVNALSASAAEIVASALQDYGRAVVIGGSRTFGKGTVQIFLNLDNYLQKNHQDLQPLGAMTLTVQKFFRVNGLSTQYRGVIPDIILPDLATALEIGERYLDNSLPADSIPGCTFQRWPNKGWNLAELQRRSTERISRHAWFTAVRERVRLESPESQSTLINLNLDHFRVEQQKLRQEIDDLNRVQSDISYLHLLVAAGEAVDPPLDLQENNNGDNRSRWLKDLQKDAYLDEAMMVLSDMDVRPK